jgi:predicted ferric reductase
MLGSWPPTRDFWTEFSVALGYAGLAMMGLQFGLTARFRYITQPWGDDLIYHVHRQLSIIAVGLVIVHPLILFVDQPAFLALLNTSTSPLLRLSTKLVKAVSYACMIITVHNCLQFIASL